MDETNEQDGPIGFSGQNAVFDPADEELLGLKSPAPVDTVANRAWEYLGRFQRHHAELMAELQSMDFGELGAARARQELIARLGAAERDIARLQVICQAAGAVSLHDWLRGEEKD